MDWIAIVTPAAVGLLTLLVSNAHARRMSSGEHQRAKEALLFEHGERRYEDRRDAVIALDNAAERESDRIDEDRIRGTEDEPSWRFLDEAQRFKDLSAAHARVAMLATPPVTAAAQELRDAVLAVYHGGEGDWSLYRDALSEFRVQSRLMLSGRTTT